MERLDRVRGSRLRSPSLDDIWRSPYHDVFAMAWEVQARLGRGYIVRFWTKQATLSKQHNIACHRCLVHLPRMGLFNCEARGLCLVTRESQAWSAALPQAEEKV